MDIDLAIFRMSRLKLRAVHTETFLEYHSMLTTLVILKDLGFGRVSIIVID